MLPGYPKLLTLPCASPQTVHGHIRLLKADGGETIQTIVIVGGHDDIEDCTPCGGCRQKIAEFASPETRVVLLRPGGHTRSFPIDELLPRSFHL